MASIIGAIAILGLCGVYAAMVFVMAAKKDEPDWDAYLENAKRNVSERYGNLPGGSR